MNLQLFADTYGHTAPFWGWSFTEILIAIVILAGAIAVTVVVLKVMEIKIPDWFIRILWIVAAVVVGVLAIKFIANMM